MSVLVAQIPAVAVLPLSGLVALGGWAAAWWLHRRTRLSARNLDLAAVIALGAGAAAAAAGAWTVVVALAPLACGSVVAAAYGRRQRLGALGAGGELREFELARVMVWDALREDARAQRRATRARGERTWVAGQGELIKHREWPAHEPFVPMSGDGIGRIPSRAGQHLLVVGGTGKGKTVSARRWLLARVLADGAGVLATDPKGDRDLERDLRDVARVVGRPFVLFDPRDATTDRWNPLWSSDTGAVVSRLVAPIAAGEGNARYYADLLQIHLGIVTSGLKAAGLWPANMPLLLHAAQLEHYDRLLALVKAKAGADAEITKRMREHRTLITAPEGKKDLTGGTLRLRVVAGETWRRVLTPAEAGAVTLPAAMAAGAIVLVRTWVDDLPDEARAITTLFLADAAAAALTLSPGVEWAALIDEFGGVLSSGAGDRVLALMQRARSAGGQVALVTQSVQDVAAVTGNQALLDALADNFAGGIFHAQTARESRDWLAQMIGTRELWQYTDRTNAAGSADGAGSRRRAREFIVRPDEFRTLGVGEAIVWTNLGPDPQRVHVTRAHLPNVAGSVVRTEGLYTPCGPTELPANETPATAELVVDDPAAHLEAQEVDEISEPPADPPTAVIDDL